jgi:protein-L-isoaspartate(D-aspartate) O-methyltransferase
MEQRLTQAFEKTPRLNFVLPETISQAGLDTPLPIGFGQTISQPSTVWRMLSWLEPQPRDSVLDIGSGSGWTSALLSRLVGPKGKIFAVERIPQLREFGFHNCQKLKLKNIQFIPAGDGFGYPPMAPFQRILVSAAGDQIPYELLDQLADNGKMVMPVNNSIFEVTKYPGGSLDMKEHKGYAFVPLKR